jgi:hypothetical protein
MTRPLRSRRITRRSPLLRAIPPLCSASVLSPSRGLRLGLSLGLGTTGSKVPPMSLIRTRAVLMPGVARSVNRHRPCSSRSNHYPPILTPNCCLFDTSSTVHLRSPFRIVPDVIQSRLFRERSPLRLLVATTPRRFAARSCNLAARGQLSSQRQLLLAHNDRGTPAGTHVCYPAICTGV